MKLDMIRGKQVITCVAIGVAGALIFVFVFPRGAISTFMHEVLNLPGPGAGIALIVGPFLIMVAIISSLLSRGDGGAVIASLTFAVVYVLVTSLLGVPTNPKGAFGSPVFIAAIASFSIAAEAVMVFGKASKTVWRCMASGALANVVLFVFYWIVIFPRTCRWIDWGDVPLLMGLCLACGLASGYVAWMVSKPLSRALVLKEKE